MLPAPLFDVGGRDLEVGNPRILSTNIHPLVRPQYILPSLLLLCPQYVYIAYLFVL